MDTAIMGITAVTDNFPTGQKITAVYIQYSRDISADFHPEEFQVEGRKITAAYANGDTVILELDHSDLNAALIPPPQKATRAKQPVRPGNGPDLPRAVRHEPSAAVWVDGVRHVSDRSIEPVIADFKQFSLGGMGYNLFVPKMERDKTYPLVLFIHDAGSCGPNVKTTLSQGNGAIGFAEPAWQNAHPCFVLAPQIDKGANGPMTNDNFTVTDDFLLVKAILDHVLENYPVDRRRVYATGQSMGCMASCEMNIRWPSLFAASLLVAGQWSPERMAESCPKNQMWILVSEHDAKAFPGMNAMTRAMKEKGAEVGCYHWDGRAPLETLEACANNAMKDNVNVRYTVFNGSSVVPESEDPNPGANHINTWPLVYQIKALKQWLFSNAK